MGAWSAIILSENGEELVLKGVVENTTHNRMELAAAINALSYVQETQPAPEQIEIYSDSQYLVNLEQRKKKLLSSDFKNRKGKDIQNSDLVKQFIDQTKMLNIKLTKVVAHQKKTDDINYNRKADIVVRKLLREKVRDMPA